MGFDLLLYMCVANILYVAWIEILLIYAIYNDVVVIYNVIYEVGGQSKVK